MSDKEHRDYVLFLENSVVEDAEAIDIPSVYTGLQSPLKNWDGNSQLPTISKDEDLDEVVNKILKRTPDGDGADDPDREEGGPTGSIAEIGNLANDAKKEIEGYGDDDEAEADDEDCPECEKKIQEIYHELGISPLSLLEDDSESDFDDEEEDHEDDESDEEEAAEHSDNFSDEDDDSEVDSSEEMSEGFTSHESKVLETLIREMGMTENEDGDEDDSDFSDETPIDDEGDDDDEDIDDVEVGDDDDSDV